MIITLDEAMSSGRGVERPFNCPAHDDKNASASVNVVKGVWFCYSCMAHGVLENHVPNIDEAIRILAGESRTHYYPEAWLDLFDADHCSPYWVKRVGIEVASANRCGTHPMGMPTYPLRDDQGRLLGVVTRHEEDPKYRYPFSTTTSRTVYGPVKVCRVLVLLEGAGDVMALQQGGLPDSWNANSVYGAGIHAPQVEIVARMNPSVILAAFDDDDAGLRARTLAVEQLADVAPVLSVPWRRFGGKDAAEVPAANRIPALRHVLQAKGFSIEGTA